MSSVIGDSGRKPFRHATLLVAATGLRCFKVASINRRLGRHTQERDVMSYAIEAAHTQAAQDAINAIRLACGKVEDDDLLSGLASNEGVAEAAVVAYCSMPPWSVVVGVGDPRFDEAVLRGLLAQFVRSSLFTIHLSNIGAHNV